MKKVSFTYQGKPYRGLLAVSCEEYPHYYWFYPEDAQQARELGECLSLKVEKNGVLEPSESYPPQSRELIEAIKTAIAPFLAAPVRERTAR